LLDWSVIIATLQPSEADQGEQKTNQTNDKINNSAHGPPPFKKYYTKSQFNFSLNNTDDFFGGKVPFFLV